MSARVAVIGASGTIGAAVSGALLERGAGVLAISRGETPENAKSRARLVADGAELRDVADLTDVDALAALLRGTDALVIAMRASPRIIPATEPAILAAALRAGIGRFVPDDFGTHSMATPYGVSAHFDEKKRFHEALDASGMAWTVIYPGGIAEYFLPNLRPPATVYAWGDRTLRLPIHTLHDIGAITARAVLRPAHGGTRGPALRESPQYRRADRDARVALAPERLPPRRAHRRAARAPARARRGGPRAGAALGARDHGHQLRQPRARAARAPPIIRERSTRATLYPDHRFEDPRELLADREFVFGQP